MNEQSHVILNQPQAGEESMVVGRSFGASHLRMTVCALLIITLAIPAFAGDKKWNAEGDGADWTDIMNWDPTGAPTKDDNVKVDLKDARVSVPQDFKSKSLIVGGKKESAISLNNFVDGLITPGNPTDDAVLNRRDGLLVLKGSGGVVKLRGSYKDSEEILPEEPSFMLYVK